MSPFPSPDLPGGPLREFILGLDGREPGLYVKGFAQDAEGELHLLAGINRGPFRITEVA